MSKCPYSLPENKLFYQAEADKDYHLYLKEETYLLEIPHYHNSLEFAYIDNSTTTAHIASKKQALSAGDICFVDNFQIHSFDYNSDSLSAISLVVSEKYTVILRDILGEKAFPTFMQDKKKNLPAIKILKEWVSLKPQNHLQNASYANRFFDVLLNAYELVEPESAALNEKAIDFLNYINDHFHEPISMKTMAQHFNYSEGRCSYLFNSYVGMPFKDCLNDVRMKNALEMIATKKFSMTDVISKSGFGSPVTFYRHYAKYKEKNFILK